MLIVENQVVHIPERHRHQRLLGGGETGGKLGGDLFVGKLGEMAIGEIHILYMAVFPSADPGHVCAPGVEIGEIDVADAGAKAMLFNIDAYGDAVAAVNDNVAEADIFNQSGFKTLVGHAIRVGVTRQAHADTEAGFGDV